eukprot:360255-Chlamydomonas_euryale.AAC.16
MHASAGLGCRGCSDQPRCGGKQLPRQCAAHSASMSYAASLLLAACMCGHRECMHACAHLCKHAASQAGSMRHAACLCGHHACMHATPAQ